MAGGELDLFTLLLNPLISRHTFPYLTISGLLNLAATCKAFRARIYHDASAFRSLDLSTAAGAGVAFAPIDRGGETWRSERMDEGVTEEDFYCGPLRGIFASLRRRAILPHVQTLVLDGQTAPAEILHEIITDDGYAVSILSVVGAKHLNEGKFRQTLQYAVRPGRPAGMPRLRGVYVFGADAPVLRSSSSSSSSSSAVPAPLPDSTTNIVASWNRRSRDALAAALGHSHSHSTEAWYAGPGRVLPTAWNKTLCQWTAVLRDCAGIIAFDAVLCQGPRHFDSFTDADGNVVRYECEGAIASIVIDGCQKCKSMPEGPVYPRDAPSARLPLLAPPPRYTSSIGRAQQPVIGGRRALDVPLYARCAVCLLQRCCEGCFMFWCEDCYDDDDLQAQAFDNASNQDRSQKTKPPGPQLVPSRADASLAPTTPGTKRVCWECGRLCADCNGQNRRPCKLCGYPFCATHYEGSTETTCDWCHFTRRRGREMY